MSAWPSVLIGSLWFISSITFDPISAIRTYDEKRINQLRQEVVEMFYHGYDNYLLHAYPFDELRPLSCDGMDTWGSYSLTLIDTLDTLAIMGNFSEFRRVAQLIIHNAQFDMNINVSVFETNIRILGGLLSAHLLSHKAGMELEKGWPCNGPLLRLAEKVARKLLPAFDTNTGMPYGTVNLRYGVPPNETPITCTAGVGTFIVEFGALSRLTGDPLYEKVALRALHSLYSKRSSIDLVGNHIDTESGKWTALDSGIGAGVDSYFEYLVKGAILFQKPELMHMFRVSFKAIEKHLGKGGWYVWATMGQGHVSTTTFQSLEAYWPGLLSLIGEFKTGMKAMTNYHRILKQYGGLPELYNIVQGRASHQREGYPLRPELVESAMYLYKATGDPYMLEIGEDILHSIQHSARTECGFATIRDVTTLTQEDRMESFFLAETVKYLYLLFDPSNFLLVQTFNMEKTKFGLKKSAYHRRMKIAGSEETSYLGNVNSRDDDQHQSITTENDDDSTQMNRNTAESDKQFNLASTSGPQDYMIQNHKENGNASALNKPLEIIEPSKYAMDILKIAEKHNITNDCVSDILKVVNDALICSSNTQPILTSYYALEKTLDMEKIEVNVYNICKNCSKTKSHSIYDRPFQNMDCCEITPSQNDDHFIIFDIKSILQMHLPIMQANKQLFSNRDNDLSNCEAISNLRAHGILRTTDYTLTLNTDGATPFKSSRKSLWPILAFLNEEAPIQRKRRVMMFGLWIGKSKPVFTAFLENVVEQLVFLENTGMMWKTFSGIENFSKITVLCVLCDSIARPLVQFTFQFNGSYGCPYCYYFGSTHYYPSFDGNLPQLRNKHMHLSDIDNIGTNSNSRGVKGRTPFMLLKYFDPINGFPPDIMHCVYLGVAKQLSSAWVAEPSKYFCITKAVEYVDRCLLSIRPPKRVSRIPSPIKYCKMWKAHEWAMWLYYYSPIILKSTLKNIYLQHWMELVKGMCIITSTETVSDALYDQCNNHFKTFVSQLENLYSIQSCTFNTHLLLHLPHFFKLYGPLQYLSMSAFETYNHVMNKYVTNSQYISSQIAKRYLRSTILKFHNYKSNKPANVVWSHELLVGGTTFIGKVTPSQFNMNDETFLQLLSNKSIHGKDIRIFRRAFTKSKKMYYSKLYTVFKKGDCNTILLTDGTAFECEAYVVDTKNNRGYGFGSKMNLLPYSELQLSYISVIDDIVKTIEPIENFKDVMLIVKLKKEKFIIQFVNPTENSDE